MSTAAKPAKEKAPSNVELMTFAIYKFEGKGDKATVKPLFGAENARFTEDGKVELLAGHVPFNSPAFKKHAPQPGHGLLMLYGIRDSLEEMQKWRAKARELNAHFAYATVKFEVGYIEVGLTNREKLRHYDTLDEEVRRWPSRFLNVRRMTADLQLEVLKHFQLFADREKKKVPMDKVADLATRPDYFDHLFQEDKDFHKHLDILVIPVADNPDAPSRIRTLAYVRPGAKIVGTLQGTDEAAILLPKWMHDLKYAKKLRSEPQAA